MKLVNYLTLKLSIVLMVVFIVWSGIYFFVQMNEIYDGIDEGLNNLKQEFIIKANTKEGFVENMIKYNPLNIIVEQISPEQAQVFRDYYSAEKVYFPTELEKEEVRMYTTAFRCELDGNYYQLQIFTSTVESDDLIENMLYLLIALWLILIITIIVVGKLIINNSSKPFRNLLDELNKFRLDELKMISFTDTNIKEYEELNNAVEKLLSKNIKVFNDQKIFIENASHELQTPLAASINKLELMLAEETEEKQMEKINSVIQILNRMSKLNNSLLLLAKIKNNQFTNEEVNLNSVFTDVIDNMESFIEYKKIKLVVDQNEPIIVNMNKDLAYILATNLMKNAVSHNMEGGSIRIVFSNQTIVIENDGAPLKDDSHIFDRYFSDTNQSTGLGLSIVKSIVDNYHFKIKYKYQDKHIITVKIVEK